MQALVLAGGRGTRLAPYTLVLPKPMLPIGGEPIIYTIVTQLARYGFNDIIVSLGYLGELIEVYFKAEENVPSGCTIRFVRETTPLGTAGAIGLIEDLADDFLVINGDILTSLDFREVFAYHREQESTMTVAVGVKEIKLNVGIVKMDDANRVLSIEEKPTYRFNDSMGIYVCNRQVLEYMVPDVRIDATDLMEQLIRDSHAVHGYRNDEDYYWIDIGQHAEFENASRIFAENRDKFFR